MPTKPKSKPKLKPKSKPSSINFKILNFRKFSRKQWLVISGGLALAGIFAAFIFASDVPRTPQAWVILAPPLKQCESENDYTKNTGNGYYGAYQFDKESWAKYAPGDFKYTLPIYAPPSIQDQAAYYYFLDAGLSPWPTCGPKAAEVYRQSTAGTPAAAASQDPKLTVDEVNCQHISGWAYDPDSSNTNIEIRIYIDGDGYNTGATSQPSADINNNGGLPNYPTAGTHRFNWPIPAKYQNGSKHEVGVYAINIGAGSNTVSAGSFGPCTSTAAPVATTPAPAVKNHNPQITVDEVSCSLIRGWAYDPDSPNTNIEVHVYIDGTGYNTGATTQLSPDINNNGGLPNYPTAGTHRFSWAIPTTYRNTSKHEVSIFGINIGAGNNSVVGSSFGPCVTAVTAVTNSTSSPSTTPSGYKPIRLASNSGLCLDSGSGTSNGIKLLVNGCNSQLNQQWLVMQDSAIKTAANRCLDLSGGNLANGTKVQSWDCVGNANQKWRLNSNQTISPSAFGAAGLRKCLYSTSLAAGSTITIQDCSRSANQKWTY